MGRPGDRRGISHRAVMTAHEHSTRREPISPAPVRAPGPDYLPAYVSNGLIGLRVREIPLLNGVAIVNGLAGVHPEALVESVPYAPYPLGALTPCGVAYATELVGEPDPERQRPTRALEGALCTRYSFRAQSGRRYSLRQIAAMVPSSVHAQPDLQASRLVALGSAIGFDE